MSSVGLRTDVENKTHPLLGANAEGTLLAERAASCRVALLLVGTMNMLKPLHSLSVKVTRPLLGDYTGAYLQSLRAASRAVALFPVGIPQTLFPQ